MPDLSLLEEVRRFFKTCPVPAGGTLVVAVSGGPDSVCMLHALHTLKDELVLDLHVAHLNHRLRGADSDADAAYVKDLAGKMGLPVTIEEADVEDYRRENRLSLEEAAREVRYAFLEKTAAETGAYAAAVGHTADDRIETVLLNLLRGAGTRGLRGLLPVSCRGGGEGLLVLRPLLEVSREAAQAYCREHGLNPRQDLSNLSEEYTRNRVRHSLLPVLKEYNPRIGEALLRTAQLAADDGAFIEEQVENTKKDVMRLEKGAVTLDRAAFVSLHPALQRGILRAAVLAARGNLKDIEAGHIEDMMEAASKPAGKVIGLPDGLYFCIEYGRFVLTDDRAALCPLPELHSEYPLNVPGTTEIPGWEIKAEILSAGKAGTTTRSDYTALLDYETAGDRLTVRKRRRGDRFRPLGLNAEKKLGVFMIDSRIPRSWRDRVPVVTSPEHILWVAGYRIDERARVTDKTRQVLRLEMCLANQERSS